MPFYRVIDRQHSSTGIRVTDESVSLGMSAQFAKDVARTTSSRDVSDVSHAIAAVGSRTLSKAEEFIAEYCPKGGIAQIEGLVSFSPQAKGSYQEVVDDPVS